MQERPVQRDDDVFHLSVDEVRMIVKYRALADHQRRGVLQAFEKLRPVRERARLRRRPPI